MLWTAFTVKIALGSELTIGFETNPSSPTATSTIPTTAAYVRAIPLLSTRSSAIDTSRWTSYPRALERPAGGFPRGTVLGTRTGAAGMNGADGSVLSRPYQCRRAAPERPAGVRGTSGRMEGYFRGRFP